MMVREEERGDESMWRERGERGGEREREREKTTAGLVEEAVVVVVVALRVVVVDVAFFCCLFSLFFLSYLLFPASFRCSFFLFLNTTFTHDALLHCRQHTNKPLEWKAVDPLVLLMFLFVGLGRTFACAFPCPHHMHTTIN